MNLQIWGAAVGRLVGAIVLWLAAGPALALNNWENGDVQYHTICTNCHNNNPLLSAGGGAYPAPSPAGSSSSYLQGRFNSGAAGTQMGAPHTTVLRTANNTIINDTVSDIAAYIGKLTYPRAALAAVTTNAFGSVSVDLTRTLSFRLSNSGTATLNVSSVSVSGGSNFSVNPNACPTVSAGGSCDIVVTFQPQSVGNFNATLTVNHDTFAGVSTTGMSGTGLTQFSVSPLLLTYTAVTAPTNVLQTTITDNKGDRLRVCRANAATFNFPTDYSLDAPSPLGVDGCFTTLPSGAVPRSIPLSVRFTAGGTGPRNGALAIQRVDGGGNPLGGSITVQLQGNPGPLATVNASSLFDAPGDPGVEVDNDNFIERTVTLFSQGSDPLVFTGGTFAVSGASAAEYTFGAGGCRALAGLPASTGGTPPSCVLTVRFNPVDVGLRSATLTITIAGTPNNVVALNGQGFRGPRLNVSRNGIPATSGDVVQFGTQTIGGLYPSIGVALNNGGTLGDLEVVLPAAGSVAGFTFTAGAGCANLAPAVSCNVDLRFDPAAVLAYASPFTVRTRPAGSAAAYDDFVLDLRGTGSASAMPVLSWTDTTGTPITRLDFPDTDAGSPRTGRVRLYNDGPGGVTLQLANVVGLDAGNFILDTTACSSGSNVFEKTSCELVVQFAPGTAGLKTATIQLTSNAGTPPSLVVAPLLTTSGTAISSAPPPTLQLSAASLQFGSTVVGAAALPLELRLLNTGSSNLSVLGLAAAAPFVVQSKSCAGVPFVLPPGHECTLSVSFQPQAEGNLAGTLSITTSASATPLEVALSGVGQAKPDLSSGGCSIASGDAMTDPTLWVLALLAALALLYRRQARRRAARDGQRRRL